MSPEPKAPEEHPLDFLARVAGEVNSHRASTSQVLTGQQQGQEQALSVAAKKEDHYYSTPAPLDL